jgi:hypothetical protein
MLKQEKELRGQTQALTWTAEAERASATGRRRTVQLGCGLQAAGMLKQEKELRGQTQALTWTAEAERASAGARKETDGAAGLWATGCGHVKAGEGAAGADARCSWEPQGLRLLLLHALSLPLPNR